MAKFLLLPIILAIAITTHFFITNVAFPGTKLAQLDVSWKSKNEIRALLRDTTKSRVAMTVKDRTYPFRFVDLGISIDEDATLATIFSDNHLPLHRRYIAFLSSFKRTKNYLPSLVFSPYYDQKLQTMIFDFSPRSDEIIFDHGIKRFLYKTYEEKYQIDSGLLKIALITHFGKTEIKLTPELTRVPSLGDRDKVKEYNNRLATALTKPVTIDVDDNGTKRQVTIAPSELQAVLGASYKPENDSLEVSLQEKELEEMLKKKDSEFSTHTDRGVNISTVMNDLRSLFAARMQGADTDMVLAKTQNKPNTDGKVAHKYIEVDLSQQRMYRFEGGKIIATHVVSTGLYYPTPTGKFKILNKAKNAFSEIYNVWMPYWMAIYLDPNVNAYIGIHELPYWYSADGTMNRRPRDYLGRPSSGGCISLDIGIAKQVQDWSDIGMPVHVYN